MVARDQGRSGSGRRVQHPPGGSFLEHYFGGGAFLNVLSVASWINSGAMTAYAVSKAAAWSLTNGLRNELRQQGTQVLGLHAGFVDTDLARGLDVVKVSPRSVVIAAFDALEAGASEVLADERARTVKRGLTTEPPIYL